MTTDELLKPRYKVIADFPQWSVFKHKQGDILEKEGIHFVGVGTIKSINENEIDNYPAIFRRLEWWEDRKPEDMPEYVKDIADNEVYRVIEWRQSVKIECRIDGQRGAFFAEHFIPATKENFLNHNPNDTRPESNHNPLYLQCNRTFSTYEVRQTGEDTLTAF